MKRILTALFVTATVLTAFAKKEELSAPTRPVRDTKYICAIGEGVGEVTFIEEFATKKECKEGCKGAAAVCEETGINTVVNTMPDEN